MATANALVKCATITVEGTGAPSGGLDYPTKAVGHLLHKPGSRQVAILAVKHGSTVA